MSGVPIPLTKGYVAIVDAADADLVRRWRWRAHVDRRGYVAAVRDYREAGATRTVAMARVILGEHRREIQIDHRNGDPLDNRRANLRSATRAQNMQNRADLGGVYKGVSWVAPRRKWQARIAADGTRRSLGYYDTPEEAARVYDRAARQLHGEFARLNFPEAL